ncbi:FAD-dependent oxidoreductase [Agrobacterium radiobacter]|uniref:FAD-dependent oxidoreductase n=1 Tax=Agrobacterium radiobacter TaxID=362 RepID=UPI003F824BB2
MSAEIANPSETYCDLLVIGTGAGGFAAAVTAARHGLKVILTEKHHKFGGTTAWSGGVLWVPCNPVSIAAGVEDSVADARAYLHRELANLDDSMVDAYLENAPRMVEFFQRETDVAFTASLHGDRHPENPGGLVSGRSISPLPYDGTELGDWFKNLLPPPPETMLFGMQIGYGHEFVDFLNATRSIRSAGRVAGYFLKYGVSLVRHGRNTRLYNGNALIARLARTAQRLAIDLWLGSPAVDLVLEKGQVVGARILRDGRPVTARTRKGVLLATGGYPHDIRRVLETHAHVRNGSRHLSRAPSTNSGDGIRMAEAGGAAFDRNLTSPAALTPVSFFRKADGGLSFQPHLFDRTKPGFIAVTPEGRRYCDETASYHDFVLSMLDHCARPEGVHSFLICDHRALRKYGMGAARQAPLPIGKHLRSGYLTSGRSPHELGKKIGIDGNVLAETFARYNEGAAFGHDPDYHRGGSAFTRLMGDPLHRPNPCIGPLTVPPFYAVQIFPGDIGTFAGLKTDQHARVLDANGAVIEGLYAAGNDMLSVMGGAYPAGGITIGPAMTFGYLAALHASRMNIG